MSGETTETLHLANLERQHIGEYSCSSTNEIGENHSLVVTLKVQCEWNWVGAVSRIPLTVMFIGTEIF